MKKTILTALISATLMIIPATGNALVIDDTLIAKGGRSISSSRSYSSSSKSYYKSKSSSSYKSKSKPLFKSTVPPTTTPVKKKKYKHEEEEEECEWDDMPWEEECREQDNDDNSILNFFS